MARVKNIALEGAKIIFRNFAGKGDKFNPSGRRNFGVLIDNETAEDLIEEGWHVKWLKAREELTEKLCAALNTMFCDSYKSNTCRNLIDIWHVLRHLQYNTSDNINKNLYDVRASEPYQGGTEPLMKVNIIDNA